MSRAQLALGVGARREMPRDVKNAAVYLADLAELEEDLERAVDRGRWRDAVDERHARDLCVIDILMCLLHWGLS